MTTLTKTMNTVTNVLFIARSSYLIFTNVRQGAPGKILPGEENWSGPVYRRNMLPIRLCYQ